MHLRTLVCFLTLATFQGTSAIAQCFDDCTNESWLQPSWTTGVFGGNPNGQANLDCVIQNTSGQFPGIVAALIKFSKEPSERNGCKFHSGASTTATPWRRWAETELDSCATYGFRIDYDLATFDLWVSGSSDDSDVFYAFVGEYLPSSPWGTFVSELGPVNCASSPTVH
jgi:hypothetical protein